MTSAEVAEMRRCLRSGGVVVFPSDTVYGLACHPESPAGVERLYALKGRPAAKPAAVMLFELEPALAAAEPGPRTAAALRRLLPGPVTAVVPNPRRRFPLACATRPEALGLRVPGLDGELAPLSDLGLPVLQSSANPSQGVEPRRLDEVDAAIRAAADMVVDGGELPGTASTVVDLVDFEASGAWRVLREGAVRTEALERALSSIPA